MFKNEAQYLTEWLNFHHGVGARFFLLFNDESSDDWQTAINKSVARRCVKVVPANPNVDQIPHYNQALKYLRYRARWIAFIDLDEFLWSPAEGKITTALRKYSNYAAIYVQWVLFGPGPHDEPPASGGVLANYGYCLPPELARKEGLTDRYTDQSLLFRPTGRANQGKSIVNPRKVTKMGLHVPRKTSTTPPLINEKKEALPLRGDRGIYSANVLRINHYWSKSRKELVEKVKRGRPAGRTKGLDSEIWAWLEHANSLNRAEDWSILGRLNSQPQSRNLPSANFVPENEE